MARDEHLRVLRQGRDAWHKWRNSNPDTVPDLTGADLHGTDLSAMNLKHASLENANISNADLHDAIFRHAHAVGADLSGAILTGADLINANLAGAHLREAKLEKAKLHRANLRGAQLVKANLIRAVLEGANLRESNFSEANLEHANLRGADLRRTNLTGANLTRASLQMASLVETQLTGATLADCYVYGISAWNATLKGTVQSDLRITPSNETAIQVDSLELAQFIYLLLNNEKIRNAIDIITPKVVLILGSFTSERKKILDAIRNHIRNRQRLPLLFDFKKPASRNRMETISILAAMSRFIIADITDAKSVCAELERIVPHLPSVPVQPILLASQQEYGMFESIKSYSWVLKPFLYKDSESLLGRLDWIIANADRKASKR